MNIRWITLITVLVFVVVACDSGDAELSSSSTIVSGGTQSTMAPGTTTAGDSGSGGGDGSGTPTTLVGEAVTKYDVVKEIPNDNGVEHYIVIPQGAYTDVDLENFVYDLVDGNSDLYGAEIFNDSDAADAFEVPAADRTDEQKALLAAHHLVTLTGRSRIDYRGPFADFPGGAIGS